MADSNWYLRGAPLAEIKRHAARLTYLGCPDKVLRYLGREYGEHRVLPSRAFIAGLIRERTNTRTRAPVRRR